MFDLLITFSLLVILLKISVIDIRERRIPNRLTIPTLIVLTSILVVAGQFAHRGPSFFRALIGMAFASLFFLSLYALSPDGIGLGDVKLAAPIGLALGWDSYDALFYGLAAMFLVSAVYSLILIIRNPRMIRSSIPFAPFMTLGYAIGLALR